VKRPQPGEGAVPKQRSTDHFELKPAQQRVLGVLKAEGASRFTRARYEAVSGVSRSQAAYDLAELVEHGILERLGSGRATRYRIVHVSTTPGRGGRRRWTQERIRAALLAFCAGRDAWPSAAEFKEASRFDLYVAASRYGGIGFWTSELGLTREAQPAPPPATPRRRMFRPRLQWVPAAAVAMLALALAGAGHIRLSHGGPVVEAAPPQLLAASLKAPTVQQRVRHEQSARHQTARHAKRASRPTHTTPARHARATSTELASVQSSTSSSSTPAQSTTPASTSSSPPPPPTSSNPAPLPPPSGGSVRHPLPPPPPPSH
jgi:hypothetical protein